MKLFSEPGAGDRKPALTLLVFALLAALASQVPSPWWEGSLLDIRPAFGRAGAGEEPPADTRPIEVPVVAIPAIEGTAPAPGDADPAVAAGEAPGDGTGASGHLLAAAEVSESSGSGDAVAALGEGSGPAPQGSGAGEVVASAAMPPAHDLPPGSGEALAQAAVPGVSTAGLEGSAVPIAELRALRPSIAALVAALPPPDSPLETPCIDPAGAAATQPCRLRAMDRFFAKLTRTAARSATRPLRISQFGDSLVMGDDFTGELRRLLQAQFGDGGHGFFYIGNPDRPYGAAEVGFGVSEEWTVRTVVAGGSSNPLYGLAGAAFVTNGSPTFNASLRDGDRPVDRVGVLYHARDTRGGFDVTGDGQRFARDLTVARGSSGIEWVDLGVEARRVRVSRFRGDWIFFGAVLEHSGPGVVVDNLGMVSGRIHQLMKIGERHWQQQIGARGTDLASFFFGVNDAAEGNGFAARSADYRAKYDGVLRRARGALPDGDCLVISILTRGDRRDGRIVTYASVGQIAAVQQQSALAQGCGFWNAYAAIGGDEGARRWYDASPRLLGGDLSHPTRTGYVRLGAMLYGTLASAYLAWIDRQIAGRP